MYEKHTNKQNHGKTAVTFVAFLVLEAENHGNHSPDMPYLAYQE